MKRKNITITLTTLIVLLTSCGTYTYQESTARYVEPARAGFITPVTADMEISENLIENSVEIEVVLKKHDILLIRQAEIQGVESPTILSWKKYALAQTLKKYKADDMVSPTFEIMPSPDKEGVIIVTVTGHTAVYKNYRKATKEDVELIQPFLEQKKDLKVSGGLILQRYK